MTLLAYLAHMRGIPIASNYQLAFPYYHVRNSKDFKKLKNCLCLLDDFNKWASSRITKHKKTELFSSVVNDSGKNNVSIIYSTKYLMQITKPIRHETDYLIKIEMVRGRDNNLRPIPVQMTMHMFEWAVEVVGELIGSYTYNTLPVFQMFDTSEIIRQL